MRATAAATLRTLPRAALALPPRLRRRILMALGAALVLWALYFFWFRDSGFVKVEHVKITGATSSDARRVEAALTAAAHDMTTLHVRRDALMSAVAGFTSVKGVAAQAHFPHGLTITVIEERPVALLEADGERLLLAADGSVLRSMRSPVALPAIRSRAGAPSSKLSDRTALAELAVAAAAPRPLETRLAGVGIGATRGIVAKLRNGPQLVFGDDTRLDAKWEAAAAVLSDPASKGASYVDVRLPERPVAGGLGARSLAPLDTAATDASAAARAPASSAGATGATGPSTAVGTTTPSGSATGTNTQPSP